MKNDWLDPEWHIHNLDVILDGYEKLFNKLKDEDERLELIHKILKVIKTKRRFVVTVS